MGLTSITIDQGIVGIYLLLMLIAGLAASRGIKTMRDYAVADGHYPSIVVTITLMATIFGGTSTLGVSEGIYKDGVIMFMVSACFSIPYLFVAFFIAPNMGKFYGMISVGDIMHSFYGKFGRVLVGVMGSILGVGALAAQVLAAGYLINSTFGISSTYAIFVSAAILILYSTFGGIKAVTITDVIQFIILIVVVPLISYIAITHVGGLTKVISMMPEDKLVVWENPKFMQYLVMFLVWCAFPSFVLSPPSIQRMLMAKDTKKIKSMYRATALTTVVFELMVCFIAFAAIVMFPDIKPGLALPSIINETLPTVVRGLAIAGILAVIMSSADSFLNSGAILFVHDILKPISKSNTLPELKITKIATMFIGVFATIIAVNFNSVMGISAYAIALWGPIITIPLSSAIMGFRSCPKAFMISSIITITCYISAMLALPQDYKIFAPLITIFTNAFTFFYLSYKMREKIESEPSSLKESFVINIQSFFDKIMMFSFIRYLDRAIKKTGANYTAFAIFCCINYIAPYFMWTSGEVQNFKFILIIRLICGALCIGILLEKIWPQVLTKYFGIYWYFTLMFCLPFTTTIMVLTQSLDTEWMINMCLSVFLLASLVNWRSFIGLLLMGFVFGYVVCEIVLGISIFQNFSIHTVYLTFYVLVFSSLIGIIFSRRREINADERIGYFQGMSGMLAHEFKTPLTSIKGLGETHKMIFDNAKIVEKGDEIVIKVDRADYGMIKEMPRLIEQSIEKGRSFIETFVTAIEDEMPNNKVQTILVSRCLNAALENFRIMRNFENRIEINIKDDFEFSGPKQLVMHMFLNILNNIADHAGKNAEIYIVVADGKVILKDNGKGMSDKVLKKIFDRKFSSGESGLGLDFCRSVMRDLNGYIKCQSKLGEYTEFEIDFNKI